MKPNQPAAPKAGIASQLTIGRRWPGVGTLAVTAMTALRLFTLIVALIVCGCTTTATRQYRADEEQKIREAVLLEHLALRDTNRVVFVAFQNPNGSRLDPSDAAISRIRAAGIPARNASESTTDEHTIVVDRASGKPGVIYYAGVVRWFSNSKVEVVTGSTCASLGGGFSTFIMKKEDGRWIRTKTKRMVTI
jgi:hypothetical protein